VWDAHKLLMMPSLVTATIFRDGKRSYGAFAQSAEYLFASADPMEMEWSLGQRTLECTKRMMSLKLYAAFSLLGTKIFGEYVGGAIDLAEGFAAKLRASPRFEVAAEPELNIVCFRLAGKSDLEQEAARQRVVASGRYFLVKTKLRGQVWLRVTLMNPFTEAADLDGLIAALG
jgi:L-2,4-diaminobutyrate decarboxylase